MKMENEANEAVREGGMWWGIWESLAHLLIVARFTLNERGAHTRLAVAVGLRDPQRFKWEPLSQVAARFAVLLLTVLTVLVGYFSTRGEAKGRTALCLSILLSLPAGWGLACLKGRF
ncbi:hypothetical protein TRVL_01514 [Trypanosoma vivax]|nr:hypothetical protein TRVL_01514 [Trypanosoma vivax]